MATKEFDTSKLPKDYPFSCTDNQIRTFILSMTEELKLHSFSQYSMDVLMPLIQLGNNELFRRTTVRDAKISRSIAFVALLATMLTLILSAIGLLR